jgi:hypothetical protein
LKLYYFRSIQISSLTRDTNLESDYGLVVTNTIDKIKIQQSNHLGGGQVVRAWDQEVCSLCGLRFEPCGCSYDGHWRLTWSLTSEPVVLVEVHANWSGHPR